MDRWNICATLNLSARHDAQVDIVLAKCRATTTTKTGVRSVRWWRWRDPEPRRRFHQRRHSTRPCPPRDGSWTWARERPAFSAMRLSGFRLTFLNKMRPRWNAPTGPAEILPALFGTSWPETEAGHAT